MLLLLTIRVAHVIEKHHRLYSGRLGGRLGRQREEYAHNKENDDETDNNDDHTPSKPTSDTNFARRIDRIWVKILQGMGCGLQNSSLEATLIYSDV